MYREAKRAALDRRETLRELIARAVDRELKAMKCGGRSRRNPLPEISVSADAPILAM